MSPAVVPVVIESEAKAALILACVPVKLILVNPVQEEYPVDRVKPVVVPKLNEVPAGGFTNPIDAKRISLAAKFATTKSPGSWFGVFNRKFAGAGATTRG
jgi:hypothetical protein